MRVLLLLLLSATPAFAESGAVADITLTTTVPRPVVSERISPEAARAATYIGTVAAKNEVALGFPMGGTVAERPVDTGDLVEAGQVLARIDPEDLQAALRAAEAGVLVATTQLRSAQDAQVRANELASRGVDSASRAEDSERALVAAQARLEQAEATLARAQDSLELAELHAPQAGVITEVFVENGATVASGEAVLQLASTGDAEVTMDLSEQDLAALSIGMRFDVALAVNPTVTATARLTRLDPVAERTTRTRRVHLALIDAPPGFRFGALVRLRPQASPDASVSLPITALLHPDSAPEVWVVDREMHTVSRRSVTLGAQFGTRVRVTGGLTTGDEVVLKGIHSLEDGQTVGRSIEQ